MGVRTGRAALPRLPWGHLHALEALQSRLTAPSLGLFPGFSPRAPSLAAAFLASMGPAHAWFAAAARGQRGSRAAEKSGRQINARYFMVILQLLKSPWQIQAVSS